MDGIGKTEIIAAAWVIDDGAASAFVLFRCLGSFSVDDLDIRPQLASHGTGQMPL